MRQLFTCLFFIIASNLFLSQNLYANSRFEYISDNRIESVKIFPNPIVDNAVLQISRDINLNESRVSVTFYNIVGKEIFKIAQVKDYEIVITKDNFKSSGMYFYQLRIDEKIQSTGKAIVK